MQRSEQGIPYKWVALAIGAFGSFNVGLDIGTINISLPVLRDVFGVSPEAVLWISLVYPLLGSSLLLTWGRLGDMKGRERVFTFGFVVYLAGLLLSVLAQTNVMLVVFRIVTVTGLSMIHSVSPAIATAHTPDRERGKAVGIFFGIFGAGAVLGSILGGFLLDHLSWQSIFYYRIVFAVAGIALTFRLARTRPPKTSEGRFDIRGAAILLAALSTLILAVNQGRILGWDSPFVISLIAATLVLFPLFFLAEMKTAQPLLEFSLFHNRTFALAILVTGTALMALLTMDVLMPFYLVEGAGLSLTLAGAIVMLYTAMMTAMHPLSGWLCDRVGPQVLCPVGLAIGAFGIFLISGLGADASMAGIMGRMAVYVFGFGLFLSPNSATIMGSAPVDRLGTASALMFTSRQIGMAIGSAAGMTLFASRKLSHANELVGQGIDGEAAARAGAVSGFHDALLMLLGVTILAMIISLLMLRKREWGRVQTRPGLLTED